MPAPVTLSICRTCRPEGAEALIEPPGASLGRAVRALVETGKLDDRIALRAIACLSSCGRACSATVAAPGKFSYVIGGLEPGDAEILVAFALRHAESRDGVPAWRDRPEKIRKNTVARVPPPDVEHALLEDILEEHAVIPHR
jgi:predicted metal-binding protein